jgi:hypothetical protein
MKFSLLRAFVFAAAQSVALVSAPVSFAGGDPAPPPAPPTGSCWLEVFNKYPYKTNAQYVVESDGTKYGRVYRNAATKTEADCKVWCEEWFNKSTPADEQIVKVRCEWQRIGNKVYEKSR